jgi:hypothetical protein
LCFLSANAVFLISLTFNVSIAAKQVIWNPHLTWRAIRLLGSCVSQLQEGGHIRIIFNWQWVVPSSLHLEALAAVQFASSFAKPMFYNADWTAPLGILTASRTVLRKRQKLDVLMRATAIACFVIAGVTLALSVLAVAGRIKRALAPLKPTLLGRLSHSHCIVEITARPASLL